MYGTEANNFQAVFLIFFWHSIRLYDIEMLAMFQLSNKSLFDTSNSISESEAVETLLIVYQAPRL